MRSDRKPNYPSSRFALKFATNQKAKIDMNTEAICDNNFGQGDSEPPKTKKRRIPRVPHWGFLDAKLGAGHLLLPLAMPRKGFWRN